MKIFFSNLFSNFEWPEFGKGIVQVWYRNFLYFRYTWLVTLFWIIFEPLFYLFAFGYGLGGFVSDVDGLSYIEFFFPALLATTAMMVPYFEATYGYYTKLTHQKLYTSMLMSPLGPNEILWGELLWASTKGFMSVIGVAVVARFFDAYTTFMIFPAFLILFLVAFCFASFGMLFTTLARNYDSFIYGTSGIIIPMSLFSGTYFPLEKLPIALQVVAYFFPLTHGLAAVRLVMAEQWTAALASHILILSLFSLLFLTLAYRRFRSKLL